MGRTLLALSIASAAFIAFSCSANPTDGMFDPAQQGPAGSGPGQGGGFISQGGSAGGFIDPDSGTVDPNSDCAESAKVIYLVTEENILYSFNPETPGMAAYKKIGTLNCPSNSTPQSMSVDRAGKAYVFYSSGDLFQVDTSNASCKSTSYNHPAPYAVSYQLGMGFTADANGSQGQRLYIQSPDFGLAVVDTNNFSVDKKGVFVNVAAELTGGIDAKLFRFDAANAKLMEVAQDTWQLTNIHTFNLSDVMAWAFSRYAGKFYMYTASSDGFEVEPSRTTVYDPETNSESTRDANLGVTVVGAGQSTCVPPPPNPK